MASDELELSVEVEGEHTPDVPSQLSKLTPQQFNLLLSFRARTQAYRQSVSDPAGLQTFKIVSDFLSAEERALLALLSDVELSPFDDKNELPWAPKADDEFPWGGSGKNFLIRLIKGKLATLKGGKIYVVPATSREKEMPKQESMTASELVARIIAEMDGVSVETITPEYIQAYKSTVTKRMDKHKRDNPDKLLP